MIIPHEQETLLSWRQANIITFTGIPFSAESLSFEIFINGHLVSSWLRLHIDVSMEQWRFKTVGK